MATNNTDTSRTKHIDVVYNYLRQAVARAAIRCKYVGTGDNPADAFTEALGEVKFARFRAMMGMR